MGIRDVPHNIPVDLHQFLDSVKKVIDRIQPPDIPPGRPSNLHVNPLPGGNQILFTGGDSADGHLLLFSDTANFDPGRAHNGVIDLNNSTQFIHIVGIPATTIYYWIVAQRGDQKSDPPTGPVSGTTLGLAVAATPHPYIPPTPNIIKSKETGKSTIIITRRGGGRNLL